MKKPNAYNTSDPAKLLELKRQEAEIMLDIVRSINPYLKPVELVEIVVNKIINQLDVNKLLLFTNFFNKFKLNINIGFPTISSENFKELTSVHSTTSAKVLGFGSLEDIGAEYVIPLGRHHDSGTLGWFVIADFAESEEETQNDLIFIETVGNFMIVSLENIYLFEEKVAKELIQQELEVAGRIQKQSLPSNFDIHERLDIYGVNIAHSKVAGDFFDVIKINDDEFYFCIADVAGKGIAAALLVATLQANLRALAQSGTPFHQIIRSLHHVIARITRSEHFVTLFLCKLNVMSMKMAYINAGHNPPFIVSERHVRELQKGCIPLGILPIETIDIGYERFSIQDLLFMYTDGIVEQFNENDEILGTELTKQFLLENYHLASKEIGENVLSLVRKHAESTSNSDDMSLLIVKFNSK